MKLKKETYIDIAVMILFIVFAGILSVYYGMERMFDTRNYHIYNPYAFLTGRIDIDIMPAGIQSYFNPLLDIPYYLMVKHLNDFPAFVTFLYGFSYALFLFMIYKIANLIFANCNRFISVIVSIFLAAGVNVIIRSIGWLSHDLFIGDLFLICIYLLIKSMDDKYHPKLLLCAGLISGMALGFKYTAIMYISSLFLTFIIFCKFYKNPLKSIGILILGAFIGFIITDGFWLYKLYSTFGNPFYPYFNWIFHSPDIAQTNIFTEDIYRLGQKGLRHILYYPLLHKESVHFTLLWVVLFINLFTFPFIKYEKIKETFNINIRQTDFITMFCYISFFIWVILFGTIRYYSPIIGLVGIVIFALLFKILYLINKPLDYLFNKFNVNSKTILKIINIIVIFIVSIFLIKNYIPNFKPLMIQKKLIRVPIGKKLIYVNDMNIPDNSFVLCAREAGIFVAFQNPKAVYYQINPLNFSRQNKQLLSENKIEEIKSKIKASSDKLFLISPINLKLYMDCDFERIQKRRIMAIEREQKEQEVNDLLWIRQYFKEHKKRIPGIIPDNATLQERLLRLRKIYGLSVGDALVLELDDLGIDYRTEKCNKFRTNLNSNNSKEKVNFFICELELKKDIK